MVTFGGEKPTLPYDAATWRARFEEGVESHEAKHRLIYEELCNILGERHVSDDLAVCEAYAREKQTSEINSKGRSEFVVLPGSTADVQQIVRLANLYRFPYSIMSSGMIGSCFAAEGIPYWCQIDPKRMNRLEIDEKNMYAIVEPYVTCVQLQVEAMKRGLYCGIPSAGGAATAMGNHLYVGTQSTAYRTGYAAKNILGIEWVLPNGEILRAGSLAVPGAGYFWGESPGLDVRAILRGLVGNLGSLGVVTRMAVKLFPWPGPSVWPVEGAEPQVVAHLPEETFRWFCFTYPTLEKAFEAMIEMGRAEIGAIVHRNAIWQLRNYCQKSRAEFWENYLNGWWEKHLGDGVNNHILVGIFGWASPKQADYEELVLKEIVAETGGTWVTGAPYPVLVQQIGLDAIRTEACKGGTRLGYGAGMGASQNSGVSDTKRGFYSVTELLDKYTPPLLDMGPGSWVAPFDFGHFYHLEMFGPGAVKGEEAERRMRPAQMEMAQMFFKGHIASMFASTAPANAIGPLYQNFHKLLASIKRSLDPQSLANPTRLIDMVEMEKLEDGHRCPGPAQSQR